MYTCCLFSIEDGKTLKNDKNLLNQNFTSPIVTFNLMTILVYAKIGKIKRRRIKIYSYSLI